MLQNYLSSALRSLLKNRLYSVINILGLAIGLAACILIALFVRHEFSFDQFWSEGDRVYRLHTTLKPTGRSPSVSVQAQGPVKRALEEYFVDEIAAVTRFSAMAAVVQSDGAAIEETIHWTDPQTAEIFSLDIVAGDLASAIASNTNLAMSRSLARKYFGDGDAIGRVLTLSVRDIVRDYRVTAVFEDLPEKTVLNFNLLSMIDESDFPSRFDGWTSFSGQTYFKLKEDVPIERIADRLPSFINSKVFLPADFAEAGETKDYLEYEAMPLANLYLGAEGWGEMKSTGSKLSVVTLAIVAVLILMIASINFMNLTLARTLYRSSEIVLRKILGAKRSQLIVQFSVEALCVAGVSVLFGTVMVEVMLPVFNNFFGTSIAFEYGDGATLFTIFALALGVGFFGGFYPALILSNLSPATVLRTGKSASFSRASPTRGILIIFQFSAAIILMISSAVIYSQTKHVASLNLGYSTEKMLIINGLRHKDARQKQQALKDELLRWSNVENAAYSWAVAGRGARGNVNVKLAGQHGDTQVSLGVLGRDHDFLKTYGIPLVAGRDYSGTRVTDGFPNDKAAIAGDILNGNIVINESAAKTLGFSSPVAALGNQVQMIEGDTSQGVVTISLEIIGIVKDVFWRSPLNQIRPEMHFLEDGTSYPYLTIRYTGDSAVLLKRLESYWQDQLPTVPFDYGFADQVMRGSLDDVQTFGVILSLFAGLAVLIACMGLYGLSSFTAERRTKEIGIRKVMGAGVFDIVRLLVWQFSKPVLLASLIAWPFTVWAMMGWLESFPYRMDSWTLVPMCLASGFTALLIAWITVGGNAAKVARTNPIEALRYE